MKNDHDADEFEESYWGDLFDFSSTLDDLSPPSDLYFNHQPPMPICSGDVAIDASYGGTTSQVSECAEGLRRRKRGRADQCGGIGTKACRERMRRGKMNERFAELSAALEPGRPIKTDKFALLGDAIRVLGELKNESVEYKEMNEKLLEEIKTLKAEKNELREEKLVLKADKERAEQQLKSMTVPPTGFLPAYPPIYPAGENKMTMFPGYNVVPMWQYLPPSARDTARDHELRPPAA